MFNTAARPAMPFRPAMPPTANTGGMQQSMRFNLGTLPYTFMQMGPDGITLNQVSASVVADVQTANSSSSQPSPANSATNQSIPSIGLQENSLCRNSPLDFLPLVNLPPGSTHVISSPIHINGGQLDNNLAAEIAQRVSNSVQRMYHVFRSSQKQELR